MPRPLSLVFSIVYMTPILWFLFSAHVESVPFYKLGWWLAGATALLTFPCSRLIRRHKPSGQRDTSRNRAVYWLFSAVMAFWFGYCSLIGFSVLTGGKSNPVRTFRGKVIQTPFGFSGISSTVYMVDNLRNRHCLIIQSHKKPTTGTLMCFKARAGLFNVLYDIREIRTGPGCMAN